MIRFHSSTVSTLTLLLMAARAVAMEPSKEELNQAHTWSQAKFAGVTAGKTDTEPPFAFTYGGRSFADTQRVFPVQFKSEVELVGGSISGGVPGFLVLEDFQPRKTRTVVWWSR